MHAVCSLGKAKDPAFEKQCSTVCVLTLEATDFKTNSVDDELIPVTELKFVLSVTVRQEVLVLSG
jgi:hypothetical protein